MRFDAEQRFNIPHERLLELFSDPDFYSELGGLPQISVPVVVSHSTSGDTVRIDLHLRYTGELPSAALTVIDPTKLTWVEQLVFDLATSTATSTLVPDHYPDRLSCTGVYSFRPDGSNGSIRRLDGDLKVRIPLVGGRVEQALVSGLREHAAAEEELVGDRLAAAGPTSAPSGGKHPKGQVKAKAKTKNKAKGTAKPRTKSKSKAKPRTKSKAKKSDKG
jgi:hypothetical protein